MRVFEHFYCPIVITVTLSAPQEVSEEEGSVIPACISVAENTLLEREITVMLFTVADPSNSQGIVELAT